MSIYFGSTTDAELIAELSHRGFTSIKETAAKTACSLAQRELDRLVHENFGRVPRGAWADAVLDLRDALEKTE
jgi:hypothetical protein